MRILLSLVLVGSLATLQAEAGRVNRREAKQGARIQQGVTSGELTKAEAERLGNQQRRVRNAKRRAREDGVISKKEKAHLESIQDKASSNIYNKKHNNKERVEKSSPNSVEGAAPAETNSTN